MGTNNSHEHRAVFLDRDGVINRNIFNPATGEYEAPLTPADFEIMPGALDALRALQSAGFLLFLVSNQPNYAKGKSSLAELRAIHQKFVEGLFRSVICFARFYYCLHHPQGVGNRFSRPCECRKPSPYFLLKAQAEFNLNIRQCWMIGDRHTDVECGNRAGTRTMLIAEGASCLSDGAYADEIAVSLEDAATIILQRGYGAK